MEMRQWLQTETIIRLVIISQDMTKTEMDQCRLNKVSVINSCIITIDRCHTLDFVAGVKDATNRTVWKAIVDVRCTLQRVVIFVQRVAINCYA